MRKFKFIDLFSGIGGFHLAMKNLGGECVFAAEIDTEAIKTYEENFHMDSNHDVTKVDPKDIPQFDVLCAGFPCQAFSKAGYQKGFSDTRGTLFFEIERILVSHLTKYGTPKFVILENVRNLLTHDDGNTWLTIHNRLKDLGYILTEKPVIISPHYFGVPQLRERVVIIGVHRSITNDQAINIEITKTMKNVSISHDILEDTSEQKYTISEYEERILSCWDEFIHGIKESVIGFPIWLDYMITQNIDGNYPQWKIDYISRNQRLYLNNKEFIDSWLIKYNNLDWAKPTDRKFEWQAGADISSVWDGIIQFRPSGIRVKRPTEFPALVAMVHIPIVGWKKRRLTPRETARLQSFPEDFIINRNDKYAYKEFGNSVNVHVIQLVMNTVLSKYFDSSQNL